ncbi:hypothetical protein AB833_25570 [Chromatiales bacterium (ex Bugula neritina AB1)]|nr:hypothetical protein AB833_25570 [Chromatiales bacterium (ex Bugula neritina AB1)]
MRPAMLTICAALLSGSAATSFAAPIVELYTSQGCYSCPPADKYLAQLISENPDLVALEFHVDYWDDLNYGAAGIWKDPFSNAEYSQRQRNYNARALKGKRGVYTPQIIINGHTAQVGTSSGAIKKALHVAVPPLEIQAKQSGNDVTISIDGSRSDARLWMAVFDRLQITDVKNGENQGKVMRNHHVVRELTPLADLFDSSYTTTVTVPALAQENSGCAVFLQEKNNGPMLAAGYCSP